MLLKLLFYISTFIHLYFQKYQMHRHTLKLLHTLLRFKHSSAVKMKYSDFSENILKYSELSLLQMN